MFVQSNRTWPIDLSDASPSTSGASQRDASAPAPAQPSTQLSPPHPAPLRFGVRSSGHYARCAAMRPPSLLACASEHCCCGRILVRLRQPSLRRPGQTRRLRMSCALAQACRICLDAGQASRSGRAPRDAPTPPSPVSTRLRGKSGHRPVLGPLSVAEPEEATFFGSYSLSSPL